jgi:hypothetical protein
MHLSLKAFSIESEVDMLYINLDNFPKAPISWKPANQLYITEDK